MATHMGSFKSPQKEILKFSTSSNSRNQPSSSESKVRVIVRVRPFLPEEISQKNGNPVSCVSLLDSELESSCDEVRVHLKDQESSRNECYKLDAFFGQEDNSSVSKIYEKEVRPLIPRIYQGCNATVFAYGATGSGKTYTMQGTDELPGLMPLAMTTILSMCHQTRTNVKISYYEVYMDRCYDLLELKEKEIAVLDDKDGQIHLKGLAQVHVNSISEFHEVFSRAIQRRKVAVTGINDVSSRSHGVLVISVCSSECTGDGVIGKLNLIDLAGNEDNRKTGNEGIRLQESGKINQSLFALSNVIHALNNNAPRVPYRESKLTRILQDSLGGTSFALMVACLNPGEYQESVHTVKLAARSRYISNFVSSAQEKDTPNIKIDMEAKLRAWLESKGKTKSAQRINGLGGSPLQSKTPNCASSLNKQTAFWSSAKPKVVNNSGSSCPAKTTPRAARKNLFNNGIITELANEDQYLAAKKTTKEEFDVPLTTSSSTSDEIKGGLRSSPLRKVLSPVNYNINFCLPDPKTPKTLLPFLPNSAENNFEGTRTPLDKIHTRSSNLKNSLVHEYVEFLNTASREELLELKGIGQKMAEYIVELRETSPLKSLNDLEKLGLSSKQVHNMFTRAATGLLGSTSALI